MTEGDGEKRRAHLGDRLSSLSSGGLMVVACCGVALMMLHVTADVVGKYVFSWQMPATLETVQFYYMVALVFLPFAYVARGEGHIFVELFSRNLAPARRAALDAAVGVLTLVWLCLLTWYAGEEAVTTTIVGELQETSDGFLLVWPSRWFVPLGCGVMAFAVVLRIVRDVGVAMDEGREV